GHEEASRALKQQLVWCEERMASGTRREAENEAERWPPTISPRAQDLAKLEGASPDLDTPDNARM
ncbi:hypothetical protein FRC01_010494, partial [Tulasnella sp. 417]